MNAPAFDVEAARAMRSAGIRVEEIMEALGASERHVRAATKWLSPLRAGAPRQIDYGRARRLRTQGFTLAEIAKRLGASESGICRALKNTREGMTS